MTRLRCASLFVILASLIACSTPSAARPTVIVNSPPNGSQYQIGQAVVVDSTSSDPQGIARVELVVDGSVVRTDPSPTGQGQVQFKTLQTWNANGEGTHLILVRATNTRGETGEAGINVTVNATAAVAPTATSELIPSAPTNVSTALVETATATGTAFAATPTATATVPTSTPTAEPCVPNSAFVADVTIPDGSVFQPGKPFVKTWRVRNTGNCRWESSYALVAVTAAKLGAASPTPIPVTAPGAEVDLSLSMAAPSAPGSYTSAWQLRASDGKLFGTQLTVVIVVPGTPTATPTSTPTNTPQPTRTPTSIPAEALEISTLQDIAANSSGHVVATCPAGMKVTGGGFVSVASPLVRVYASSMEGNGWAVDARNNFGSTIGFFTRAICVSNLPGATSQVSAQKSVPINTGYGFGPIDVTCPAGTTVTGGGYTGVSGVQVYISRKAGNGWELYVNNNSGVVPTQIVNAICYDGAGADSIEVEQVGTDNSKNISAVANCPGDRILTGGGFGLQNFAPVTQFDIWDLQMQGSNGWKAIAFNTQSRQLGLFAHAICTKF